MLPGEISPVEVDSTARMSGGAEKQYFSHKRVNALEKEVQYQGLLQAINLKNR
jgi:hypothetical protein